MVRRATAKSRKASSSRSPASSSGSSTSNGPRLRHSRTVRFLSDSDASSTQSRLRKLRPTQAPRWMQRVVSLAFRDLTSEERAETLAILHIALDWTRTSEAKGWVRFQEEELPGYVVRRLYRQLVLPKLSSEDAHSPSDASSSEKLVAPLAEFETGDIDDLRCELPTLIPWLPLSALLPLVELVEYHLPHLASVRETCLEEMYEMDVDEWPPELVRTVWKCVEPVVRETLRGEYASLLLGDRLERGGRYALRSRR